MIAEVIIDVSSDGVDRIFDYNADADLKIGSRVVVSFFNRRVQGYVISLKESSEYEGKLKDIEEVLDEGIISGELLSLMRFMTDKYNLRHIDVLRLFLPPKMREGRIGELKRKFVVINPDLNGDELKAAASGRSKEKILELFSALNGCGDFLGNIKTLYGGTVDTLIKKKILTVTEKTVRRSPGTAGYGGTDGNSPFELSAAQRSCVAEILKGGNFLLHGVTGSGKTEVYMRVIEENLKAGKTAVMLVPEISLTARLFELFKGRFKDDVAVLHSGLSTGERFDEWKRILDGDANIVIGARSAIFAPLKNIGAVIVDEEHDGSYISESNPRYDAKTVAAFRAEYNGAALIFGSATPSVDTYHEAKSGRFKLLSMPERINKRCMPEIEIIDMCQELRSGNNGLLSRRLEDALRETLNDKNQAMIYLNRRGYSSFVLCRQCGYVAKCSDCDISLTYHADENQLKCHYCGKRFHMIKACPECGSLSLRYGKTGTEKAEEIITSIFPNAKILRMDNDTTREKDGYEKILAAFYRKEADILIGTQMIAKGHDFPDVTLVGLLDADMSLYFSDYRSNERTFQLTTQVSGRAGREKKAGRVILQTYVPRHYVFNLAKRYDYKGFYEKEINSRETTKYPPFTVIVRVLASADTDQAAMDAARRVYKRIKGFAEKEENRKSFIYLNAMRSPVGRIQNKYRYQILMRIKNDGDTENIIRAIYKAADEEKVKDTAVFTEINPQSLV